jgi:hypothetical protein
MNKYSFALEPVKTWLKHHQPVLSYVRRLLEQYLCLLHTILPDVLVQ